MPCHLGGVALVRSSASLCALALTSYWLLSCSADDPGEPILATTQHVRASAATGGGTLVGANLLLTDANGQPVPCDKGELSATITLRSPTGTRQIESDNLTVRCADSPTELSLVVDNSGSEEQHLQLIADAAKRLTNSVIESGGGASLVRVSTESRQVVPLTSSQAEMDQALDGLFVNRGWTALYDGIRLGNETLGASQSDSVAFGDAGTFCSSVPRRAIVVLTDGHENNSANEHANENYPGDGVDTSLNDLKQLKVNGTTTAIYALGMGGHVDHEGLTNLAAATGGRYRAVSSLDELPDVFDLVGQYVGPSLQVCGELDVGMCGAVEVAVSYRWTDGQQVIEQSSIQTIDVPCPEPVATGRTATILLTLSNPGIPETDARALAVDAVHWVSPVAAPRVLVIRDDQHQNEFQGDSEQVAGWLADYGLDVDFLDEPQHGVTEASLADYDVVWFSNPGYPMDDQASFMALQAFSGQGGGIVLQGDDMAWSWGQGFSMTPLTGLEFEANGTNYCGRAVDNNRYSARYRVQFDQHPVTVSVANATWLYGDDIDTTRPTGSNERVIAWADLTNRDGSQIWCEERVPVITVLGAP